MNSLIYDKIVLFGDSITEQCFGKDFDFTLGNALQDDYVRKLDVLNRGYGVYIAKWAMAILPKILAAETSYCEVKLVIIFFGTNDSLQKVPVDEYKEHLTYLVDFCRSYQIKPILVGPTLFDGKLFNNTAIASNLQNLTYSEAAKAVAKRLEVPFVDLWNAFRMYGGWSLEEVTNENLNLSDLFVDGVHFTPTGYRIFYEQLKMKISAFYPELDSVNLESKLLSHEEMFSNNGSVFK